MNTLKIYSLLAALLMVGIVQAAHAVTAVGPVDPLTGFPVWVQDANGLQLQPCGEPTEELTPGCIGFEDTGQGTGFVAGNIAEFSYYRAEAGPDSTAVFRLRLQVQGADAGGELGGALGDPANSVIGNEALIRWRQLPVLGNYTFTTPVGSFTMNANATDCVDTSGDGSGPWNCPDFAPIGGLGTAIENPPFASTLAPPGAVTHFMSNTTPPGPIGPIAGFDPNLIFLGDFFTMGALNNDGFVNPAGGEQIFRITGPAGADLDGAGGNVVEADFLVEGLTIDCVNNLAPLAVEDNLGAASAVATRLNVLGNDLGGSPEPVAATDPGLRPDTVTITTPPVNGTATVNPDGTVSYTSNDGYFGDDSFSYQVLDGCLEPAQASIATANIVVENLGVTTAVLRVKQFQWRIEGQTSNTANNTITLHAGPDGTGPVIGSAAVDPATGEWSFEGRSAADPGGSGMISCVSSTGALLPSIKLSLR